MPQAITRAGWIRITAITIVGLALWPFTPGYRQFRAYRRTKAIEEKLKPILAADARFKNIRIDVSYGLAGVLRVTGQVDSDPNKEELKRIITQNNPTPSASIGFHAHTTAEISELLREKAERGAARKTDGNSN